MPVNANDLGPAGIEQKMKRPALESAERLMVELARNVARNVADHETHDLLVDAALASVDALAYAAVHVGRRKAARGKRRKIDERARGRQRMEAVCAPLEVVLDHSLAAQPRRPLLDQFAPGIGARVLDGARVIRVRRDFTEHVVVAERDVAPPLYPQRLARNLDRGALF